MLGRKMEKREKSHSKAKTWAMKCTQPIAMGHYIDPKIPELKRNESRPDGFHEGRPSAGIYVHLR